MESRALAVASFLVLLAAAPIAGQSATPTPAAMALAEPTNLYFHLLGVEDFHINTQPPADSWTSESLYGATTATISCLSPVAGNTGGFGNEYHTFYGVPYPGLVGYDNLVANRPTVLPQRGLAANVTVAGSTATLVWYVSVGSSSGTDTHPPTPVPNVVLRATVRPSDAISVDDLAYNEGDALMVGETRPATLVGPAALGPDGQAAADVKPAGQVDGRWIYEFTLPLQVNAAVLSAETGFNVRVDLFMENPSCADPGGDGYAMPSVTGMHTSPAHRPRLELATEDPMWAVTRTEMQSGHLIILASIGSAWGAYDVDDEAATITIDGPEQPTLLRLGVDETGTTHAIRRAKVLAWAWPDAVTATPGMYNITITTPNLQGTAVAAASTEFAIAPDGEAPGLAMPLLGAALLGLAVVARRR